MNFEKLRSDLLQKCHQEIDNGNNDAILNAVEVELATEEDLLFYAVSYDMNLSDYETD